MSLIEESEEFLAESLEDTDLFGWVIKLTNELGTDQELTGQVRHINMLIDIESGTEVQSEQASATVRLSTVTIGEPAKNWKADITDTNGNLYPCYVVEAMPDRTMGIVVLKLGRLDS